MTFEETVGMVAVVISFVGMVGGVMARDRYINKQINEGDSALAKKVSDNVQHLHDRIDRLKDDTVRIATHDKSVERIENAVIGLRADMAAQFKMQTEQYTTIISKLADKGNGTTARNDK